MKTIWTRVTDLEQHTVRYFDVRAMTTRELENYLAEQIGHMPTKDELERIAAGEDLRK